MRTYKIARVTWNDISSHRGWTDIENTKDYSPLSCVSVGALVKVKRGNIGLVQSIAKNRDVAETIVIPKKVVVDIEVLGKFKI